MVRDGIIAVVFEPSRICLNAQTMRKMRKTREGMRGVRSKKMEMKSSRNKKMAEGRRQVPVPSGAEKA